MLLVCFLSFFFLQIYFVFCIIDFSLGTGGTEFTPFTEAELAYIRKPMEVPENRIDRFESQAKLQYDKCSGSSYLAIISWTQTFSRQESWCQTSQWSSGTPESPSFMSFRRWYKCLLYFQFTRVAHLSHASK